MITPTAVEPTPSPASVVRYVWRDLRLLILLTAVSLGAALFVRFVLDYPIPLAKISVNGRSRKIIKLALLVAPLVLAGGLSRRWWALRDADEWPVGGVIRWRLAATALRQDALVARIVLGAASTLLMALLFAVAAMWKSSIPVISPWHWDVTLSALDRVVHGGVLPQDFTRHWFGPLATKILDRLYFVWFTVLIAFVVWQSFRVPSRARSRALLAMGLAYTLLGNVGALLLSSGGPVYYGRLVKGVDPYAAHQAFLEAIPGLNAVRIQHSIWDWLQTHTYVPFGSISAMPSMHVAATTIMALACWEFNRWLGAAAWLYVLTILLGSVQLNWHYAIDGYVSIFGTLAIWQLSGWVTRRSAAGTLPGSHRTCLLAPV